MVHGRKKSKHEWVPYEMVRVVEQELKKMQQETKQGFEPKRVEAWQRIADMLVRHTFKNKKIKEK